MLSFALRSGVTDLLRWAPRRDVLARVISAVVSRRSDRVECLHGFFLRGLDGRHLLDALMLSGAYEPATASVFKSLLKKTDAFIDIGANIGFFSLMARAAGFTGPISAFEPNPEIFGMLRDNVATNRYASIALHNCAVGDHSATIAFDMRGRLGVGSRIAESYNSVMDSRDGLLGAPDATVIVPMRRVDDVDVDLLHGKTRILIKIDVEGWELAALRGMTRTLAASSAIIIERNDDALADKNVSWHEIADFLRSKGFSSVFMIWDRFPLFRKRVPKGRENYLFVKDRDILAPAPLLQSTFLIELSNSR